MSRKKTKEQTIFGDDSNKRQQFQPRQTEISQFCKDYLSKKELFKWFIEKYYGLKKYLELWELAEQGKEDALRGELNSMWYELPDNIFNLQVCPPGWETFVTLIDE